MDARSSDARPTRWVHTLALLVLSGPPLLAQGQVAPEPVPQASNPRLSHDAPRLGETLRLTVEDAPPGATVRLYGSPQAGSFRTRYGIVELDPGGFTLIDTGTADAQGRIEFAFPMGASETDARIYAVVDGAPFEAAIVRAVDAASHTETDHELSLSTSPALRGTFHAEVVAPPRRLDHRAPQGF